MSLWIKERYKKNPEYYCDSMKERYEKNPKYWADYCKKYRNDNRDKVNNNSKFRYDNDIQYKLRSVMRARLNVITRNSQKSGSAVRDLGCTVEAFKLYLESLFSPEMTWENWGSYWHIDHIKPLSKFDLTDRNQLLEACHYTNLQPLYWRDNLIKGDYYA